MRREKLVRAKTKVAAAMFAAAMTVSGAAPIVSMTIPVMALEPTDNSVTLTTTTVGKIEISNAEADTTFKVYQLVTGEYRKSDNKLVRYRLTELGNAAKYTKSGTATSMTLADLVRYTSSEDGNTDALAEWTADAANKAGTGTTYDTYQVKNDKGAAGSWTNSGTTFTSYVEPGLYLVVPSNSKTTTLYNPVLLSVSVTDANNMAVSTGNTVDLNAEFQNGKVGSKSYVKKTSTGFEKNIINITDKENGAVAKTGQTGKGDAVAIGDTVEFRIDDMTIPSYSGDYTSVQYKISDMLEDSGFDAISNLTVYVGGTADSNKLTVDTAGKQIKSGSTKVADLTGGDGSKSFTIAFTDAYIKSLSSKDDAARKVVVTYQSKLATTAGLNYAENFNHATLNYSNDPTNEASTKEIVKNTYHYTFGIDASIDSETLDGTEDKNNWETHEINKVTTASGEGAYKETSTTYSQTVTNGNTKKSTSALYGAGFTLYTDEACTTKAKAIVNTTTKNGDNAATYTKGTSMVDAVATSDENGHISFIGLDEGTYYMKETEAPSGYTLDSHVYKIVIDGTFDETTGIMTSYSITTYRGTVANDKFVPDATVGEATYKSESNTVANDGSVTTSITSTQTSITPAEIVDTKLQDLPFTGGEGATNLIIGATFVTGVGFCLVMYALKKNKKAA